MHFLGKAQDIPDMDGSTVIQDGRTAHPSEHLVLVGNDHLEVKVGSPVQNRNKVHLKSPVRGSKLPWIHEAGLRDMECHIIQLVGFSVVKDHILGCRSGIAKAVTNVKTKAVAVQIGVG